MTASAPISPIQPATAQPLATPPHTRLRAALRTLRWSYGDLGMALMRPASTMRSWGIGQAPVPCDVLAWVELLAAFHRKLPPPEREG